ncbi:MAG: hypothetical protein O2958_02845 [Gemmatimonadetes bacterium]|nr:hypothetical protein [Gemmatimonadota bacterium]MDA1102254.1 hypothetical protein [Gemmatimonadota bacterium]
MRLFVFALPDASPLLFPGLVGLMVIAGVLAVLVPTRRALAIQPVEALRYDT